MQIFDGTRIRACREASGISTEELKSRLGVKNLSYLYSMERGDKPVSLDYVEALCDVLGISPLELMHEKVRPGVDGRIPVVGQVAAGEVNAPEFTDGDYPVGYGPFGDITVEELLGDPNAYAVRVDGDSMRPHYAPGDILVVCPNLNWHNGDLCIVRSTGGSVWVKIVWRQEDILSLTSHNPGYEPITLRSNQTAYVHKVKLHIRK